MNTVYRLTDVAYEFPDGRSALRGLSLKVSPGERLAIIGPNGSGKTTLLFLLDALLLPSSGTIEYGDEALTERRLDDPAFSRDFRSRVSLLFQNSEAQLFSPTVRDEIAFGPRHFCGEPEVASRVDECSRLLSVEHLLDRSPVRLSAGEKKRVALAAVLANRPDVLLMDEPTSGLDPRNVQALLHVIATQHAAGKTIVTATHDIHLVWEIADRVVVLSEDHAVVTDGPTATVLGDRALLERHNLFHEHIHRHGDRWHRHAHGHDE